MNRKCILAVLFMVLGSAYAGDVLKVVICAGQSNMLGKRSTVAELPEALQGTQKNLLINMGSNGWEPIEPGKSYGKYQPKGFGPEVSFAAALSAALNEPIGIIKHSQAGTNLAKQWSGGNPYQRLAEVVKEAKASKNIEIIGMLWMQGESDSKEQAMAESYQANLEALIQSARTDFESPNMIFIAGRTNPQGERFPFSDVVRKAQETCGSANYAYIDCDTLPKVGDGVHYTTAGVVEMGQRFSNAMAERLSNMLAERGMTAEKLNETRKKGKKK